MNYIFFIENDKKHYLPLLLITFFPLSISKLGPIKDLLWTEMIPPFALFCSFAWMAVNKKNFFPSGSGLIILAMFVLGFLAVIHNILSPIESSLFSISSQNYGFRRYYEIVIGLCLFFYFLWFSSNITDEYGFWKKILINILYISLVVGYLRLFTFLLGIDLPFLSGNFKNTGAILETGEFRIGGLTEITTLGISALIALYYQKSWSIYFYVLLFLFLILLILSGGRTASLAIIMVFLSYLCFIEIQKSKDAFLLFLLIGTCVILILFFQSDLISLFSNQFGRLMSIKGGIEQASPTRYKILVEMWTIFLDNPILGKGIGYSEDIPWNVSSIVRENLINGGHGGYLSILMLFGFGGVFFIFVTLFGSITKGYFFLKEFKSYYSYKDDCIIVCFCTVYLAILAILFIAEGSGYNKEELYVLSGIVTGKYASNRTFEFDKKAINDKD
jgi:hypothetical protein